MTKLRSLPSLVRAVDTRTTKLLPEHSPIYDTPEYRAWRAQVIARADGRCEAVEHGHRCSRAAPEHRMYADHIIELRDDGAPFDVMNGRCLCASHHIRKTMTVRTRRHQSSL